jgi:hypothetical protein
MLGRSAGTIQAALWGAGIAAALVAVPLIVQTVRLELIKNERDGLRAEISDPDTGYIARLTQCRSNGARLAAEIERQNGAIEGLESRMADAIAAAEAEAADAREEAAGLRARARRFIERPIAGETACARAADVDAAFMAELESRQ